MPNVVVKITANGVMHTYSPSLSGENGQMVETDGVYDFSPYDVLLAGIADGADDVFSEYIASFAGTWQYDSQYEMIVFDFEEIPIVYEGQEPAPDYELRKLNCGFTWNMTAEGLELTHVQGDEIFEGSAGGTFTFVLEYDYYNPPKG